MTINYLTRVEFGEGQAKRLPELLKEIGVRRPLIVTDAGVRRAGLVARVLPDALSAAIFDGTPSNPTEAAVLSAFGEFSDAGCDGIVAVGGGSAIDLAKAVRILTGHPAPLSQYAAVNNGARLIGPRMCPLIAVPTTAGTGSEVGRAAVIITAEGRKLGLLSPHNLPTIAICDPELTYGLPPFLTAATGMDALSHCLETYMAPSFNPPADAIALDGLERGMRSLATATFDGSNVDARRDMMVCALEGALAFQKGLGAVHALTHPLGAIASLNLHHGTLNAVLMPAVLRFNRAAIGEKWGELERRMGGTPYEVLTELNRSLGMPNGLRAMGVTDEMMISISTAALTDHTHATNPRVPSVEDYLAILKEAA